MSSPPDSNSNSNSIYDPTIFTYWELLWYCGKPTSSLTHTQMETLFETFWSNQHKQFTDLQVIAVLYQLPYSTEELLSPSFSLSSSSSPPPSPLPDFDTVENIPPDTPPIISALAKHYYHDVNIQHITQSLCKRIILDTLQNQCPFVFVYQTPPSLPLPSVSSSFPSLHVSLDTSTCGKVHRIELSLNDPYTQLIVDNPESSLTQPQTTSFSTKLQYEYTKHVVQTHHQQNPIPHICHLQSSISSSSSSSPSSSSSTLLSKDVKHVVPFTYAHQVVYQPSLFPEACRLSLLYYDAPRSTSRINLIRDAMKSSDSLQTQRWRNMYLWMNKPFNNILWAIEYYRAYAMNVLQSNPSDEKASGLCSYAKQKVFALIRYMMLIYPGWFDLPSIKTQRLLYRQMIYCNGPSSLRDMNILLKSSTYNSNNNNNDIKNKQLEEEEEEPEKETFSKRDKQATLILAEILSSYTKSKPTKLNLPRHGHPNTNNSVKVLYQDTDSIMLSCVPNKSDTKNQTKNQTKSHTKIYIDTLVDDDNDENDDIDIYVDIDAIEKDVIKKDVHNDTACRQPLPISPQTSPKRPVSPLTLS